MEIGENVLTLRAKKFLMRKIGAYILIALAGATAGCGRETFRAPEGTPLSSGWMADTLTPGFEMRYVRQADDYSGEVRSTVIRRTAEGSKRGVLYMHGFNDYFFQAEMANRFVDSGYSFYAVDLRKYGRSLMEGQRPFEARDMREYFADIDSGFAEMHRAGIEKIALMGHSTGGLTAAYYMDCQPDKGVKCLVLNSPFLDWNLSPFLEKVAIPAVTAVGRVMPGIPVSQGESHTYAHSLLREFDGEWEYDTRLKFTQSPDVTSGWIRAITLAQRHLHEEGHITVPILLLHSDSTYRDGEPTEMSRRSDAVLDVTDISRYGRELGGHVTEVTVKGGLHDLMLSRRGVREPMMEYIFEWLRPIMTEQEEGEQEE